MKNKNWVHSIIVAAIDLNRNSPLIKILILQIIGILLAKAILIPTIVLVLVIAIAFLLLFTRMDQIAIPFIIIALIIFRSNILQVPHLLPPEHKLEITGVIDWIKVSPSSEQLKISVNSVPPFSFIFNDRSNCEKLPGDSLVLSGILIRPDPPRNPGQFDYGNYLRHKGISFILTKGEILRKRDGQWSISRQFYIYHKSIKKIIQKYLDEPFTNVMTGLILGNRSGIEQEMKKRFQEIGVIHILAVSGLHVGYIFMILTFVAKGLSIKGKYQFIFITLGLLFYSGLTGFTTSVVRASLMAILYSWGKIREKNISTWNIISASAMIILAIHPGQLFTPGFQLSFGAIWGILFVYPRLQQVDSHFPCWKSVRANKVVRAITNLFYVTIGAQIGTFIPVAVIFKFLPIWGLLSNLFIVFLAGVAVISGILMIISFFISNGLATIFGHSAWIFLWLLNLISEWIYLIPFRKIPLGGLQIFEVILIFIILIHSVWAVGKRNYKRIIVLLLGISNLFVWKGVLVENNVKITFLDVGQGDACVIQDRDNTILIDTGYGGFSRDMGQSVILPYLASEGITDIDLLIISHPHSDHIGGAPSIISSIPIKVIWDTYTDYHSQLYSRVLELCREKQIVSHHAHPGDIYQIGELNFSYLYPPEKIGYAFNNVNNSSIVIKVDHQDNSVLFVGDIEEDGEDWLTKIPKFIESDVIKIGHHGSKTSSTIQFCNSVSAKYGVISVGKKNKFNHPYDGIIRRWESMGTNLFRTDQTGAVTLYSDGHSFNLKTMLLPQ
ncbi:MAG: DNA internalization-related competence protein ComEC/Rec2 [Fidelibacterota bacterium]